MSLKEVKKRKLNILVYAVAEGMNPIHSQFETHKMLKKLGFPTADEEHLALCYSSKEIMDFAHKIQAKRGKLPFEIDGIVVKVDDVRQHQELGVTGKAPRYAVAYKFAPERAKTIILDITVQIGRTLIKF